MPIRLSSFHHQFTHIWGGGQLLFIHHLSCLTGFSSKQALCVHMLEFDRPHNFFMGQSEAASEKYALFQGPEVYIINHLVIHLTFLLLFSPPMATGLFWADRKMAQVKSQGPVQPFVWANLTYSGWYRSEWMADQGFIRGVRILVLTRHEIDMYSIRHETDTCPLETNKKFNFEWPYSRYSTYIYNFPPL